ncbi:hypothetical protein [Litoribacillus peritrichatus]|uniref:Uncharacterized protein n=1 Tax=Litoribacillus peritrichatus TaxID=718191 RepID=A0ABP7MKC7_9GAMM
MIHKIGLMIFFSLFASVAACSEQPESCPMDIRPVDLAGLSVAFNNFDAKRAEHLVSLTNGDLLLVRYNANCGLGLDISYFSLEGFLDRKSRQETAAWLVSLFKNYESFNQYISEKLDSIEALKNSEFSISIPGEYGDEEHYISLKDISVSDDYQSLLFKNMMTYSWLPPSGE